MQSDEIERALATALEVLAADPAIGPLEIIYVDNREDVLPHRFALLVYAEKKVYFFDRDRGSLHSTTLIVQDSPQDLFEHLLEQAKALARTKHLRNLFVVKREGKGFFARA